MAKRSFNTDKYYHLLYMYLALTNDKASVDGAKLSGIRDLHRDYLRKRHELSDPVARQVLYKSAVDDVK